MNNMMRNKWQVRLAALAVFLLGFVAGALALNAYRGWSRATRAERGGGRFERTIERLQLNDEQKTQVRQILADAREQMRAAQRESEPRFAEIRRQSDERMRRVLTPEQWERFQQMKEEMRGRRRGRGRHEGERPPQP
jgi:periplasmic protein CpxP/Spy